MFTGDRSGEWLFRALWETGFASQPTSSRLGDGLELDGAWITAALRCAPPANRPRPAEIARCQPFLLAELRALREIRVVVALGRIGWHAYLGARRAAGAEMPRPLPRFGHGARARLPGGVELLGTFHPSQLNTFTGRLTRPMLRAVFATARRLAWTASTPAVRPALVGPGAS